MKMVYDDGGNDGDDHHKIDHDENDKYVDVATFNGAGDYAVEDAGNKDQKDADEHHDDCEVAAADNDGDDDDDAIHVCSGDESGTTVVAMEAYPSVTLTKG